ncbi:ATP synthase subunit d, mitochondrial [Neocloeon triangulifer]|uniref:ATP synthase subunit d, mitochondrial n=1 Tax=Neocloeon triangulifer TaxID=2078957 RepID=UPI00286F66BC|nr:ATP synthase subunit d, mitochondrial [Neocloeon triangulifer]
MASKRIAQSAVNWAALAERVPESQKIMLSSFKSKSDNYLRRVLANPEAPPKIDWAFYKSRIALPSMVDTFQKQYEALKVPYPADNYSSQVDDQAQKASAKIKDFVKESNSRIEAAQAEVAKINALLPYSEMTMEEFYEAHPEHAISAANPTAWPHHPEDQKAAENVEHH